MATDQQTDFSHGIASVTGVLVTNLGTPDEPTTAGLRRYLAEFLWDPRIVEIPRVLWWVILHGVILRVRPAKSAHAYQRIWTDDGSPLLSISRKQSQLIQSQLEQRFPGPVAVALGMRYGRPSIAEALRQLRAANARRILVLPLYPQYSAATTASSFDAVADELKTWRWVPELRMIAHYHDDPGYIDALATSIREYWSEHGQSDRLLFSFHGMPRRTHLKGDPYFCECQKTARLVAEKLQLDEGRWQVVFQSRFGREEWLKPYADRTLEELGRSSDVKSVDVVCPGFSADCLETLEEMNMLNREAFLGAGGERYHYIPALNDRADHIDAICSLVIKHCQGWIGDHDGSPDFNLNPTKQTELLEKERQRAIAMGAPR